MFVTGVDPEAVDQVLVLTMVDGDTAALGDGELLVASSIARRDGLRVGQEVRALFADSGVVTRQIGGVFEDNIYAGYYLIDAGDFAELTGKSNVWYVYAAADPDRDPVAVKESVAQAIEDTANTQALTLEEYTQYQDEVVDQALAGIYFMLLFAVVVAVVGRGQHRGAVGERAGPRDRDAACGRVCAGRRWRG